MQTNFGWSRGGEGRACLTSEPQAIESEWLKVQKLHEEVFQLRAELELGKLPSEVTHSLLCRPADDEQQPHARRKTFMLKMCHLQALASSPLLFSSAERSCRRGTELSRENFTWRDQTRKR